MLIGSSPSAAPSARAMAGASHSRANRHLKRVLGQRRNSPGAGSSTGVPTKYGVLSNGEEFASHVGPDFVGWFTASSRASTKVSALAPHAQQAPSAAWLSTAPRSNESSRYMGGLCAGIGIAPGARGSPAARRPALRSAQSQTPLEVVDVGAALLESRVVADLLMQRHVGLDPLDHHLGERILHARDGGLARIAVRNDLADQ